MWTRKAFLKSLGIGLYSISIGGVPLFLNRTVIASSDEERRRKTLIVIFQRGAMDGLMAVSPFKDSNLKKMRPTLMMNVGHSDQSLIDLDGSFGLHPAFNSMLPFFTNRELAIVHGVGSPYPTRSHFDAQNYMESGTPGIKGTQSGWLNRAVGLLDREGTPLRSVSVTKRQPFAMQGDEPTVVIPDLRSFGLRSGHQTVKNIYQTLYSKTRFEALRDAGQESISAMKMISAINAFGDRPAKGIVYPKSGIGNNLRQIAQLIKADVGLEIAFTEMGGWDTHRRQGTTAGSFARQAKILADSVVALWRDLEDHRQNVVLMTMTEFGRTVRENGSGGTDHGRASCLFVLGTQVDGGKVHGHIPVLTPKALEDQRDLPVTTDFRSVFTEVVAQHLSVKNDTILFPGWSGRRLPLLSSSYSHK